MARLIVSLIYLLSFSVGSFAAAPAVISQLPENCQTTAIKAHDELIQLNVADQKNIKINGLYLIKNITASQTYLNHPLGNDPGASAGWMSQLNSGHWSALWLTQQNFALSCEQVKPGQVSKLNCSDTILVCRYPNPKHASKNRVQGNYWVAEDLPLKTLIKQIKLRGFDL